MTRSGSAQALFKNNPEAKVNRHRPGIPPIPVVVPIREDVLAAVGRDVAGWASKVQHSVDSRRLGAPGHCIGPRIPMYWDSPRLPPSHRSLNIAATQEAGRKEAKHKTVRRWMSQTAEAAQKGLQNLKRLHGVQRAGKASTAHEDIAQHLKHRCVTTPCATPSQSSILTRCPPAGSPSRRTPVTIGPDPLVPTPRSTPRSQSCGPAAGRPSPVQEEFVLGNDVPDLQTASSGGGLPLGPAAGRPSPVQKPIVLGFGSGSVTPSTASMCSRASSILRSQKSPGAVPQGVLDSEPMVQELAFESRLKTGSAVRGQSQNQNVLSMALQAQPMVEELKVKTSSTVCSQLRAPRDEAGAAGNAGGMLRRILGRFS